MLTPEEFREAFRFLVGPYTMTWPLKELAQEMEVPWQEISRAWREGCAGGLAKAMELAVAAKRAGRPWRKNEVAIVVVDGQFVLDIPPEVVKAP